MSSEPLSQRPPATRSGTAEVRSRAPWVRLLARTGLTRRTGTDAVLFTGSHVLYQGAKFAAYLAVARLLGPTLYGLWNGLVLLLTNGIAYGHFGTLNAMGRELPLNEGRGRADENGRVASVAFTVALATSSLLGGATLVASVFPEDPATRLGLRATALLLVLEQGHLYFEQQLRGLGRFRTIALEQGAMAVLLLTVVVGLTWAGGFAGFLGGQVAAYAGVVAFLWWRAPLRPRLAFDRRTFGHLVRVGFPMMAAGFAYGMLTSVDRLMVLAWLGKTELGFYSLAFMAYGTMMLVPRSVAQMVYPRMASEYGRTGDPAALRGLVFRPTAWLSLLMVPLLGIVWWLGPWFVELVLPQFTPGIPAFRVIVVGVFFLSFIASFGNFLNVVDRRKTYLAIQVAALALNLGLNAAVLSAGHGIVAVAAATVATQIAYTAALVLVVHRIVRRAERDRPRAAVPSGAPR